MILEFQVSLASAIILLGYISSIYCCRKHRCELCHVSEEIKEEFKELRRSKRLQEKLLLNK